MSHCVISSSSSVSCEMCSISLELNIVYLPEFICWEVMPIWVGRQLVVVCGSIHGDELRVDIVIFSFPNLDNKFLCIEDALMVREFTKIFGRVSNCLVKSCCFWFIVKVLSDNGVDCVCGNALSTKGCVSHDEVRLRFSAPIIVIHA